MFKRVDFEGPYSDPDEYWFECNDCAGSGETYAQVGPGDDDTELGQCPGCDGTGRVEGDASDL